MSQTICHFLKHSKKRNPDNIAIKFKKQRQWQSMNWQNFYFNCENIAASLIALGAKNGDRIVILSNTRPEWLMIDLAIMSIGCVTVPIYQSSLPEEVEFIINDSQPTLLILENALQVKKILGLKNQFDFLKKISLEPNKNINAGGCIVQTNYGEVDSRIDQRLEKLWDNLKEALPKVKSELKYEE